MADPRTTTRRGAIWWRILSAAVAVALVIVVAAAALIVLFPKAGMFSPIRAALLERVLSAALGSPVDIEGPVTFDLGPIFRARAADIRVERYDGDETQVDRLDRGSVGLTTTALLAGRFELRELELDGVHLAQNSKLFRVDVERVANTPVEVRLIGVVPWIVYLSRQADVRATDVSYTYKNPDTGWLFDVALDELSNTRDAATTAATLTASGKINGKPITIDDAFVPADGQGPDRFAMTITGAGAILKLSGSAPENPEPTLKDMAIRLDVSSIGELLELFELKRTLGGSGTLGAEIARESGLPALRDLTADLRLDDGTALQVKGGIEDLANRGGFDFVLDAARPSGGADGAGDDGLLDFEIYQITARLTGDAGSLAMTDGWITTNLFAGAIPQFGPISATAVRRKDNGQIAVDGLNVLAGPPDDYMLDLNGQIGNLLQLSEFALKGTVSIPAATLLRLPPDGDALGRLAGMFAVSDAAGTAGIDTLNASITGSKLLSADVSLKADQSKPQHSATFNIGLDIHDYAQLAAALTVPPVPIGAIGFKGGLTLSGQAGEFDGQLSFGKTVLSEDLSVNLEGGRPVVTGTISSPDLILADVAQMLAVGKDIGGLRAKAVAADATADARTDGRQPKVTDSGRALLNPRIDIQLSAGRVDGGGDAASGVSGRFGFDDGLLTADGVRLKYRSGSFDISGKMRVREAGRPFSVNGKMSNWPIGEVLNDLRVDLPLTGSLAASFDVNSSGDTVHETVRAAKGNVDLRLLNGSIGNRMLDLSGLVLPSWLFSESAKTGVSRLECFNAKVAFSPGVAVVNPAIVQTDEVIVHASGRIDFKADTIDIEATPKALHPNLIPIVSPFSIRGALSDPRVEVKGGVVGRAAAETLALPFNALGTLLGIDKAGAEENNRKPNC